MQAAAVIITGLFMTASVIFLGSAAFVRFPRRHLWLAPTGALIGISLGILGDIIAPHPVSRAHSGTLGAFIVCGAWILLLAVATPFMRKARSRRGWLTEAMHKSRVMYPASTIGSRIHGADSQDGATIESDAVAVSDWGGKLLLSYDREGYSAVITKRSWIAVVSEPHPTIDAAVTDVVDQLKRIETREASI